MMQPQLSGIARRHKAAAPPPLPSYDCKIKFLHLKMPSAAVPKLKRRSPEITSISHSSSPYPATPTSEPASLAPPLLPAHIQSSLFTVGMRIRKAVAQGYKTKRTSLPSYHPARVCDGSVSPTGMSEPASDLNHLSPPIPSNPQPVNQLFILENGVRARSVFKRGFDRYDRDVESEDYLENQGQQHNVHHQGPRSAFDTIMSNRHLAIPKSKKRRDARQREHHATAVRKKPEAAPEGYVEDTQEDFDDAVFLRPLDEVNMDMDDA